MAISRKSSEADFSEKTALPGFGGSLSAKKAARLRLVLLAVGLFTLFSGIRVFCFTQFQIREPWPFSRITSKDTRGWFACRQDSDCALAVLANDCCFCPQAFAREIIEKEEELQLINPGQAMFLNQSACRKEACPACLYRQKAVCRSGRCVGLAGSEIEEKKEDCFDSQTGTGMNLREARLIAQESECSRGELKEEAFCNETTGTWWLGLDVEKPGCFPACVVDVTDKTAVINWRCTGLIIEETPIPSPKPSCGCGGVAGFVFVKTGLQV